MNSIEPALRIRNVLLRTFVINYLLIVFAWILSCTGAYDYLMGTFFDFEKNQSQLFMAYLLGFWKILGAAFFLIPAIAIHWEYVWAKKKNR